MNIVSAIINRENISYQSNLNIVWTPTDNKYFTKFIEQIGHTLIDINDIYFGDIYPHLIICNDKIMFYDQVKTLSIRCYIPILVIDHNIKKNIFDHEKLAIINDLPCSYHVATNDDVYASWGKYHDQVLNYNINDSNDITIWNNLLYNLSKKVFNL